jgi:hypothetical protein
MSVYTRDTDTDTSEHPMCAHADFCPLQADGLRNGLPLSSECALARDNVRLTPGEVFALARNYA